MRKIVILRTGDAPPSLLEPRGDLPRWIAEALGPVWQGGFEAADARTDEPLPDPRAAAAFVITGSAANVPNREPWMLKLEAWLREAVLGARTPTFGICFGHQILAQALGGEVQRNAKGREIGTVVVERTAEDPIFDGLPGVFEANATHVDTVVRLPEGAVSLARSSLEQNQAIRFHERCYGVQFHPEMDAFLMRGLIEIRREILAAEGFDVDALSARASDATTGRETLRNFVRHVASHAG